MEMPFELCRAIIDDIMTTEDMPSSDLGRLEKDVLSLPREAALPCNLPEYWLPLIARDLEITLRGDEVSSSRDYFSAPLALIVHISFGRTKKPLWKISEDELIRRFSMLRIEILLEIARRKSVIDFEPATLKTIFTSRELSISLVKKGDEPS